MEGRLSRWRVAHQCPRIFRASRTARRQLMGPDPRPLIEAKDSSILAHFQSRPRRVEKGAVNGEPLSATKGRVEGRLA